MSAETLRRAAALMRERAEAAGRHTPPPWLAHPWTFGDPSDGPTCVRVIDGVEELVVHTDYSEAGDDDATHIASWHPAVALAVADWLDRAADMHEHREMNWHERESDADKAKKRAAIDHLSRHALAVARAYLGDQS